MELTKEQIRQIDIRLENNGIKYWDIRIEMLDHVVTDVENSMEKGETLENAISNSFISLGWKKNYNGSNFEKVFLEKTKIVGRKYKKQFLKEFKSQFKKPKIIFSFIIFALLINTFSHDKLVIKAIVFSFLALKIGLVTFFLLKYKITKSAQLNFAFQLGMFALSLLNCFLFMPKMFFEYNSFNPQYLAIILTFLIPYSVFGIQFFFKEYKKVNEVYQKLISE